MLFVMHNGDFCSYEHTDPTKLLMLKRESKIKEPVMLIMKEGKIKEPMMLIMREKSRNQ